MDCTQCNHEDTVINDVALLVRFANSHDYLEFNDITKKNKDVSRLSSFTTALLSVGSLLSIVHP